jgi:hypothetical protein
MQCQSKPATHDKIASLSSESTSAEIEEYTDPIDSIHVIDLKNNFSIEQQFSPMIIQYTLLKKAGNSVARLDSISTYRSEDFYYKQGKLSYDFKNDWCVFGSTDSGSNNSVVEMYYVRASDNRLKIIFEYNSVDSYVETESEPTTFSFLETAVLSANKKQIVLKSTYSFNELDEEGKEVDDDGLKLEDKATFMFNPATGVFEFENNTNPRFSKIWKGESFLDVIPL